jgi:hypothetical protein
MSSSKIYFPISEDYESFVALTNSKDGLVLPVISENDNRFHVTAYIKESEQGYFFDVHVKDQSTNKYFSVLRATLTKQQLEEFGKKCENFAFEIYPIVSKYFVSEKDIKVANLYCIDCANSKRSLPVKLSKAKQFWKSLSETKEKDILVSKNCSNPEHKIFYDSKKNVLLHKMKNSMFFAQYDTDTLVNELGKVYEKHFSEEMKMFEKMMHDIINIIQQERNYNEQ